MPSSAAAGGFFFCDHVACCFQYIHAHGTQPEDIKRLMHSMPFVSGFPALFEYLSARPASHQSIIVSDANSFFIDTIMANAGLSDVITRTYSNPAWFDDSGCLCIKYYHTQDWCTLSTKNMCKGAILSEHLHEQAERHGKHFDTVLYIGDGSNDLCPALRLRAQDYVLPRVGFKLLKLIEEGQPDLKAQVRPWSTGQDILDVLGSLQRAPSDVA